ncbi:MAG: hypothetical protein Q4P65_02800 [Eubacteriales bacterium]|nr:hypothetical protein [Eubacteriales bacterium]
MIIEVLAPESWTKHGQQSGEQSKLLATIWEMAAAAGQTVQYMLTSASDELEGLQDALLLISLNDQALTAAAYAPELTAASEKLAAYLAADKPILAIGPGFELLVYTVLRESDPKLDFALGEPAEINERAIFSPRLGIAAGREGSMRSTFEADPDRPWPSAELAPVLMHKGELELHPAIQGRLYRAGWTYPFVSEDYLLTDSIASIHKQFALGLIANFDLAEEARPALIGEFLKAGDTE